MRIYLDSSPVIYYVQEIPEFGERSATHLERVGTELVASELTRLECRVKPYREANHLLLQQFDSFFKDLELVSLSREVFDIATRYRATLGYRTPDAIHLAAGVVAGCTTFLTNDGRLSDFPEMTVQLIE